MKTIKVSIQRKDWKKFKKELKSWKNIKGIRKPNAKTVINLLVEKDIRSFTEK